MALGSILWEKKPENVERDSKNSVIIYLFWLDTRLIIVDVADISNINKEINKKTPWKWSHRRSKHVGVLPKVF